jgi:hypothetical protein
MVNAGGAVFFLDKKSRTKEDNLLEELQDLADIEKPKAIKAVRNLDSKQSDLMQLCDILVGLVRFYNMGKYKFLPHDQKDSKNHLYRNRLWAIISPYYGKGKPISCHEIRANSQ